MGLGKIKRRDMVLDPQVSPEEIKSREYVELGLNQLKNFWEFFCFSFPMAELWTLSLLLCSAQQLGQQLHSTLVAAQCRADTALTFCCSGGGPWHPWSSGLVPVLSLHSSSSPPPTPPESLFLIGHLTAVDIKQNYSPTTFECPFKIKVSRKPPLIMIVTTSYIIHNIRKS